jgi:phosphoribosylformylglycinamidine synthase
MIWKITVFPKEENSYRELISQIKDLEIKKEFKVIFRKIYFIEADLDKEKINKIASTLLIDPVLEDYSLEEGIFEKEPQPTELVITYNPGVCDPTAISLEKAIRDLSLEVRNTRCGRFYKFFNLTKEEIEYLAPKVFYNPLIEHILDYRKVKDVSTLDEFSGQAYKFKLNIVNILDANDAELNKISKEGCLSLSLEEMRVIKDYFKKLGRNPTDCELETIAVLWSEHCSHKTFRGVINYEEKDEEGNLVKKEKIENLLKSTIMKATQEINHVDCVSVFDDNSGIVKFDDKFNICFKVETHNHPSSLEPYGGSSTGIGGVIRDILGTGQGAKPFASIDVFCFSPWQIPYQEVPPGILHPKRIIKGVVKGVRDYGNRMGIPTVAGAVIFDKRFLGNPLVYCGTLGILDKNNSFKKIGKDYLVVLCGAKTGRDGIHGATFSSQELDEDTSMLTSAVQIGNPIEEKKLTEAILRATEKGLISAITDCGAGGLSSAVTELAKDYGVQVYLERVPLKYKRLSYTEIWISESQERMVMFIKKERLNELKRIFEEEDVELTVIGKVTEDRKLVLFYENNKVAELDMDFIFKMPKLEKDALWILKKEEDIKLKEKDNYNEDLKSILARPNIAPKDWILREYDHEVQAGSVIKSIYGIENLSVSDAAVLRPNLGDKKCIAVGVGINPFYSDIDPYWMAALSLEEALRNVFCVGGSLEKTFILDNFSWGSPDDKKVLAGLVRAAKGCYDFSTYFGVPFISGKDSLYNEYIVEEKRISIPGTLLVSAISIIDDWSKVLTASFKKKDNLIYIVGFTKAELGASEYFRMLNINTGSVPKIDKIYAKIIFDRLSKVRDKELIVSCHDISEGGLAVALFEICISNSLGANIFLVEVPHQEGMLDYEILFSESPTRFIVEVEKDKKEAFEKELKDIPIGLIGCVSENKKLIIYNKDCKEIVNLDIEILEKSWLSTFREFR